MAINYGLLDTTIPAQLGALPGNTLAKFLQNRQQVEDRTLAREEAGTRNALARMQLTRGEREMAEEDAYKNALAGVQGGDYEGAMPRLLQASPTRALALKKSVNEGQRSGLETQIKRFELIDRAAGQFAANPTRQTGVWVLSQLAANGTPPEVIQQMSAKLNAAHDEDLPRMAQAFLSSTQEGMKAKIAQMYPKPAQQTSSTLGRLLAERDSLPSGDPRRAQYDQAIVMETTRKEPAPYVQFLPSAEGYLRGNTRTGQVTPVTVGGPPRAPPAAPAPGASPGPAAPPVAPATPARTPMPAASDPDLQARLAAAKARGTAEGEATAKAQGDLPRATAQADELLQLTEELLAHPGLGQAVGTSSVLGVQKIPGTDARDFSIRLEQIRGKQFLEAFQALKGSGAITETEGKKATEAIARMDTSSSEPEFKRAVSDFQGVVRAGLGRTKARASDGKPSAPAAPRGADTMPPPAEHTGRIIRDSSTGVRYRSDGSAWLRVQ